MYKTDFWTLWEKARVGRSERTALKPEYYQGWNRSPAPVGCMRQVLGPGALGWPRGLGWGGRWERGLGWGIRVTPWLIHVNVWQNPLQCCEVISLQLIKKKKRSNFQLFARIRANVERATIANIPSFKESQLHCKHKPFLTLKWLFNVFSSELSHYLE